MTSTLEQALHLAQSGQLQQAIQQIEEYLSYQPANGQAWNDAGVILASQGKFSEAIYYFQQALNRETFPPCVYRNIAVAYLRAGKPDKALAYFEPLCQHRLLDMQLAAGWAQAFEAQGNIAGAISILARCEQALGVLSEPLEQRWNQLRSQRAKLAFFVGGDGQTFLKPIIEYLAKRHPIEIFDGGDAKQFEHLLNWCDIAWCEWATNLAQTITQTPRKCRVIVRLHRYEAYEPWPAAIRWENVDCLITVGNSMVLEALKSWQPDIQKKTSLVTIPNGVDLSKIPFRRRQAGKKVAFVGNLRWVKNPHLFLLCAAELLKQDPSYHFYIAGAYQDILMRQLVEHAGKLLGIQEHIHYCGYQKDIVSWLEDKSYIVSTSMIESQGMAILEAMAAGIKPVIFHFPGADEIYPTCYLFNTPQEFCEKIRLDDYYSDQYRDFVALNYSLEKTLLAVENLISLYEKAKTAQGRYTRRLCEQPVECLKT